MEGREARITIRFFAPFREKDYWTLETLISPGENLISVFSQLEDNLYQELKEKILDPPHPRYAVALNGRIIPKDRLAHIQLKDMDQVTIMALLVGG